MEDTTGVGGQVCPDVAAGTGVDAGMGAVGTAFGVWPVPEVGFSAPMTAEAPNKVIVRIMGKIRIRQIPITCIRP